jgi:hypothetical protein
MERRKFEAHDSMQGGVIEFLSKFDAIFTLNQDTLLEYHYAQHVPLRSNNRYQGFEFPGPAWCSTPGGPTGSRIIIMGGNKARDSGRGRMPAGRA